MSDPLSTPEDCELFLYTLTDRSSSIRYSTVTFVRRGATLARVSGEIGFDHDIRLVVRERLVFSHLPMVIDGYAPRLADQEVAQDRAYRARTQG